MCAVVRRVVFALECVRTWNLHFARQLVFKFSLPRFREFRQGGLHHKQICSDWTAYRIILASFEGKSKRLQLQFPVICLNLFRLENIYWYWYEYIPQYTWPDSDELVYCQPYAPVREHWRHIMGSRQPCLDVAGEGLNGLTISSPNGTGYSVC